MSDRDVDQLGDAIFPFCYDGSYLGVWRRKLSGGHDKSLDFCHLSRIMVVEQLDLADVRCISTGANDRSASHDLRLIEDRVAVTADNEVNVVHRFSQGAISTVAGVGQEDDDIDIGSDRVNGRTDGLDLPVESHPFVASRRGDFSGFLCRDADDADAQVFQAQRREGRVGDQFAFRAARVSTQQGKVGDVAVGEDLAPTIVKLVVAERDGVIADGCHHGKDRSSLKED